MDPAELYIDYLKAAPYQCAPSTLSYVIAQMMSTQWEEPISGRDWNNIGVLSLIESTQCSGEFREACLEGAIDAFRQGEQDYSLCSVHLAIIDVLLGKSYPAHQAAFIQFLQKLNALEQPNTALPGLIYLPYSWVKSLGASWEQLIIAPNVAHQSVYLSSQVLCQAQLVFYNPVGLRFFQLASSVIEQSAELYFQLGIGYLMGEQWEGLFYLHKAKTLAPTNPAILQALFLTYRKVGNLDLANEFLDAGRYLATQSSESPLYAWTRLTMENPFTYVPFNVTDLLAVEPDFRSIVTGVLIAQQDWFEKEMEFWRESLKPGMNIIDVGSNAGVYTFSAARQVGPSGRVLAIEPYSKCVNLLEETRRVNQLDWVTICAGAASNRPGKAQLAIHAASELNELVAEEIAATLNDGAVEEVACFTLDSLVEQEQMNTVDFLKIDAEGHEISVLQGSAKILQNFRPCILYENIAGNKGGNVEIANFLKSKGYELFYYQPYLQNLLPIEGTQALMNELNIIAVHQSKTA